MAGLVQIDHYLKHPESKQEYTKLCKLAIEDFNSKNDKMYVLEEIGNLNATFAAGEWLYLTFTARDTIVDAASDDDAIKTFQAKSVFFSRTLPTLSISEKKKNKKKKKKKSQLDGKTVTEAEQDKPSLVKSFVPGLVIEELAKGKPGGKKAYAEYKVGVRYTGKLKENDKIFGTNIGKGDPLEFRIGMRVGDKRRISIPPDLGYGDKGDGGVVPPNSWLVV